MDYPDDPLLENVDDEYMMGDRLLVAPLFAGEAERKVLLPSEDWQNFWTGERVTGRLQIIPSTASEIPVYVRAGSLVPWADVGQHTGRAEARRLTVRIYGDGMRGWSSVASAGGLKLRWDPRTRRGAFTQSLGTNRPFDVMDWQRIG
jgi:alpha-D-xyloside xylohydrolase